MTEQVRGGGPVRTWMSDDAAARWQQSAAVRNARMAVATDLIFDLARLAPGMRVLDVGTGTGDTAIEAARRVGPTGSILATDVSAPMLAVCLAAAREQGLANVGVRTMDAAALDLPAGSFDAAISRNALQFVPDHAAAFLGIRRALRGGGRAAVGVLSGPARNPLLALFYGAVHEADGRAGAVPTPVMLSLGEAEQLATVLGGAGFRDVEVHPIPTRQRYASAAEATRDLCGRPLERAALDRLGPDARARALALVEEGIALYAAADGTVDVPGEMLVAAGTA